MSKATVVLWKGLIGITLIMTIISTVVTLTYKPHPPSSPDIDAIKRQQAVALQELNQAVVKLAEQQNFEKRQEDARIRDSTLATEIRKNRDEIIKAKQYDKAKIDNISRFSSVDIQRAFADLDK